MRITTTIRVAHSWRALCAMSGVAMLLAVSAHAQKPRNNKAGYDNAARATVLHTANVYVSADSSAPPIATVAPGHEVVISARNGAWVNVFANTDAKDDTDPDSKPEFEDPADNPDPSSGWDFATRAS